MIAVLGGLGASVCFSTSALCASAASRRIGAASTLAWVMTIGFVLLLVPLVLIGNANGLSGSTITLLTVAGLSNVAGLGIEYVAFRRGKVGVITPIASTEGAIAALIAVVAGLQISLRTALLLFVVTFGVVLAAAHPTLQTLGAKARAFGLLSWLSRWRYCSESVSTRPAAPGTTFLCSGCYFPPG